MDIETRRQKREIFAKLDPRYKRAWALRLLQMLEGKKREEIALLLGITPETAVTYLNVSREIMGFRREKEMLDVLMDMVPCTELAEVLAELPSKIAPEEKPENAQRQEQESEVKISAKVSQ